MLVLVLVLCIIYWLNKNRYFLLAAMLMAFIGLVVPSLAEKIHQLWTKLGHGMGFVMNRCILTLVFFLFLVPLAFFYKISRKSKGKMKRGDASYFKERNYTYTKESLENVW